MNGFLKVITAIMGVLAVLTCLATIGIVGYAMMNLDKDDTSPDQETVQIEASAVPTELPADFEEETQEGEEVTEPSALPTPVSFEDHVHDYKETVVRKATCYRAGQIRYACECGDEYYVDVASTGHVADDWEVRKQPTATEEGLRVKKCIYCDEVVASEPIAKTTAGDQTTASESAHVHQYAATTEREPSCVLAGLRKYSCNCGSFYTEMIPAPGHVASDWTVAQEAASTQMGREQRTCTVCGVVLDSRPVSATSVSASSSPAATTASSPAVSATAGTSASASPAASASPSHAHNYVSYVLKEANCTEKGIRSFVCNCGSSYAESIELDLNNHTYRAVVIPATATTQGYTVYTCVRCNSSYYDNYTPPLDPTYANGQAQSSPSK